MTDYSRSPEFHSLEAEAVSLAARNPKAAAKLKLVEDATGTPSPEYTTDTSARAKALVESGEVDNADIKVVGGVSRASISDGRGGDEVTAAARLAGTVQPYGSRAEMQAVVKSSAYKRSDTATHAQHRARLAVTDTSALR